jgi:hypothetical protein
MEVPSPTNSKKQKHISWSSHSANETATETESPQTRRNPRKKKIKASAGREQRQAVAGSTGPDHEMENLARAVAGMNITNAADAHIVDDVWWQWNAHEAHWDYYERWHGVWYRQKWQATWHCSWQATWY